MPRRLRYDRIVTFKARSSEVDEFAAAAAVSGVSLSEWLRDAAVSYVVVRRAERAEGGVSGRVGSLAGPGSWLSE